MAQLEKEKMKCPVKITVLKKLFHKDLVDLYTEKGGWQVCDLFNEGDEFLSRDLEMPENFCNWAWADIQRFVMALSRGANFHGQKPGIFIGACSDGYRPVIFKLERISADQCQK